MGPTSVDAYDKLGIALRLETTTNDVTFCKHLAVVMRAANMRYLDLLPALDDPRGGAP